MYGEGSGKSGDDIFDIDVDMEMNEGTKAEGPVRRSTRDLNTLISWLMQEAAERDMTTRDLADELGVTFGYLAQLRNGIRSAAHISREFAEACAEFLEVPMISILIAAGVVRKSDFYGDAWDLSYRVEKALAYMRHDRCSGLVVPQSLDTADLDTKLLMIQLYERVTGMLLVPDRANIELLLDHCEE